MNGELTIGENIGDLGGLSIALEAYRIARGERPSEPVDGYTDEQRLFFAWAALWQSKSRPETGPAAAGHRSALPGRVPLQPDRPEHPRVLRRLRRQRSRRAVARRDGTRQDLVRLARLAVGALGAVLFGCTATTPPPVPPVPAPTTPAATDLARRAVHTATELGDGTALVAGGCDVDGCSEATASVALLTSTGARSLSALSAPRDGHAAVLLDDGRVLVVGGYTGENRPPLATTEIFDPSRVRWQSGGALATARGGHAAARLGDGRMLVAGGWQGPGTYLAKTEIFDPRTERFVPGPTTARSGRQSRGNCRCPTAGCCSPVVILGENRPSGMAVLVSPDGRARTLQPGLRTPRFKHTAVATADGPGVDHRRHRRRPGAARPARSCSIRVRRGSPPARRSSTDATSSTRRPPCCPTAGWSSPVAGKVSR